MRKVNTELSGGLQLSSNVDEDNLEIAPEAFDASMRAYHGQAGAVRRVGDERVPETSVAWIETFPLNGLAR